MRRKRPDERPTPSKPSKTAPGKTAPGKTAPGKADATPAGERIAKIIARAGVCSRRDAEAWIAQGRVAVNGKTLTTPAVTLGPTDQISIDGNPLAERQRTRLFLFHKPKGLVTTHKDPEGRTTLFDYLHDHAPQAPRLMSIGRLDINTEGLLLLTNDGGLARVLELPTTGWLRRYRVRANGETTQAVLDGLAKGVTIDGVRYAGIEAVLDRQQGANCWLTMGLREGKNREIKRVLEHLGLTVNRLIRLSFGPFQLGELAEGRLEEVRTRVLRDQLGTALAQAAGVDFEAPLETVAEARPEPQRQPRADRKASAKPGLKPGVKPAAMPRPKRPRTAHEPEAEKIKHRPQPGPRKHVSALRAPDKPLAETGARRRIETSETKDRKGRTITIERHVEAKKAVAPEPRPMRPKRLKAADGERPARKTFAEPTQGRGPISESKDRKGRAATGERHGEAKHAGAPKPVHEKRPARATTSRGFKKDFAKEPRRDERPAKPRSKKGSLPSRNKSPQPPSRRPAGPKKTPRR